LEVGSAADRRHRHPRRGGRSVRALHEPRTERGARRRRRGREPSGGMTAMTTATPPRPVDPAVLAARDQENVLVGDEIVRHRLAARGSRGSGGGPLLACRATGMPIWMPLFGWMAALFGGLSVCRVLHPWFGLAFF